MQQMVLCCKTYCSLNMFQAPLCPSSGAQECYTGGFCLWYLVLWFTGCWSGVKLYVMCPVCRMLLLMMGIMVPETCWANNKFCNKEPSVSSSWPFYFHVFDISCLYFLTAVPKDVLVYAKTCSKQNKVVVILQTVSTFWLMVIHWLIK